MPNSESLCKRRPRFQRQKSNNKCDCHSTSKNKSSCDSLSISNFYVKKSFIRTSTPSKNQQNDPFSASIITTAKCFLDSSAKKLDSTRIQNKVDSQHTDKSFIHKTDDSQVLVQGFLASTDSPDQNKKQSEALFKKTIFYKEKCSKYQNLLKEVRAQKTTLEIQAQIHASQIENLQLQIERLKAIIDGYLGQENQLNSQNKKFSNKNLSKLKENYQKFRQEEQILSQPYEKIYLQKCRQVEDLRSENEQLRQDFGRQNELFNLKIKMMQEKEEFLQKTLSFTKNTVNQLQRDYEEKQGQILETKRLTEIINQKNRDIETFKTKYQNIVKMINGQKRRSDTTKGIKECEVPCSSRSRHSLEVKSIIYGQKQNGQGNSRIWSNVQNPRIVQNLIEKNLKNKKVMYKENYLMEDVKNEKNKGGHKRTESENILKNINEDTKLRQNSLEITFLSSNNSLELSPEKSQN